MADSPIVHIDKIETHNHYSVDMPEIKNLLHKILNNQRYIMATLQDLQAAVAAEDTVIDSAITLINGLAAQIAALQPDQAAIDALAADVKAKADALSAAVIANTPAVG